MDVSKIPAAFNEWMRRYIEEPSRFLSESEANEKFLRESSGGKEPTYGESCTRYLMEIAASL